MSDSRDPLRLMAVTAHPDDESLGMGGTLARYAAEGVETYLVAATRGERGRFYSPERKPGPDVVGRVREDELRAAARELGMREVRFLDYVDGELDRADPAEAIARIVGHLRRVRPQVVVTFDPFGAYGHPDHIAICQFTTAAVVAAAEPGFRVRDTAAPEWGPAPDATLRAARGEPDDGSAERVERAGRTASRAGHDAPHAVAKLYYMAWDPDTWAA
ncbi:MAG: PIG-L deacetylase family protein, partial [Gemmatimonadota bacterium]